VKPQFKLNGKDFNTKHVPPLVYRLCDALAKLPDNELYSGRDLAQKIKMGEESVFRAMARTYSELVPYCVKVRYPKVCFVFGNSKTISKLKKEAPEVLA